MGSIFDQMKEMFGISGDSASGAIPPDGGIEEMTRALDTVGTREVSGVDVTSHIPMLKNETEYIAEAYKLGKELDVDGKLLHAMMKEESGFDPQAVSDQGAKGLLQMMPGASKDVGLTDHFNPNKNIRAGAEYTKKVMGWLELFGKRRNVEVPINAETISAAYHMGASGLVNHIKNHGSKWKENLPPKTKNHMHKVTRTYNKIKEPK